MKNIITIGLILLSIAVNAQNIKLGECKSTQEYMKQAMECYYIPQWNTQKDSVDLHVKRIDVLFLEMDRVISEFMEKKYTEEYTNKLAQDYSSKLMTASDVNSILALSEANESMQTIGTKIVELNANLQSELTKLKSLAALYNECGLNLDIHFGGLYDATVDKNRKTYAARFPAFYTQAIAVQKKVMALRKSHLNAALKLQFELIDTLRQKYESSKMMMLESYMDQQKALCYTLIKEYVMACKELLKPYQMYQLREEKI